MNAAFTLLHTRPDFRRLWLGNVASQLGDWIGWVAVAMVALHKGGGPLDLALVFAAHHLPAAALSPFSGVLADRIDRRTILWVSSLALGVLTLLMALAASAGAVGALQLLLLVRSGGVAFFTPAERAALPRLVHKDELLAAGALDAATWSVVFSLGMAAGGVLTMLGPTLALSIDAATFGVAALFFLRLPPMLPATEVTAAGKRRFELWRGIPDALRFAWVRPTLRRAVLAKPAFALASGAAWMALAIAADTLGGAALGGVGFGFLHAVRGVGTGVGPVLVASQRGSAVRLWRTLYWVGLAGVLVFGFAQHTALLLLAAVGWGIGGGANWVVSAEQIQRLAPDRILARTNALDQTGMILSMTLGAVGIAVAQSLGVGLGAATLLFVLPAGAAWWALDRTAGGARYGADSTRGGRVI